MKQIQEHLESPELGKSKHLQLMRKVQTTMKANEMFPLCENDGNVEDAQDKEAAEALLALLNSQNTAEVVLPGPSYRDSVVQVNTSKVLTLCELISSDEKLKNFTGINNHAIINSIVETFSKMNIYMCDLDSSFQETCKLKCFGTL
ncbi:hypothetical protein JTB14_036783 [Gonioctena quinquepunctata]|nr:hypothetical protein JTB14_036783 [Gonioctena quinquepunctata]